jgi:hypothetical protein
MAADGPAPEAFLDKVEQRVHFFITAALQVEVPSSKHRTRSTRPN